MFVNLSAYAGNFSTPAVPTKVDLIRDEGFVVSGEFGNPAGCSNSNNLFIRSSHPQYKMLYSMAVSALVSKQKLYAYAHDCAPILWYSVATYTYNHVTIDGSLSIVN